LWRPLSRGGPWATAQIAPPLNPVLFVAQHVSMLVLPLVLLLLVFLRSSQPHPKPVLVISMFLVYAACSMSVKLL